MATYNPEAERKRRAEQTRRLIEHLDADLAARREAVSWAEGVLRDANLRDFRTTMTGLFDTHASLETVAIEQVSRYNDEFTQFGVEDIWVNGHHGVSNGAIVGGYVAGAGLSIYDLEADRPVGFSFVTDQTNEYGQPNRNLGAFPSEAWDAFSASVRETVGEAYPLAEEVRDALRDLGQTYGLHFFWDLFGDAVTVHVDRESIHVTTGVSDPDGYSQPSDRDLDWIAARLGPLTEPYLTSPERQGAAGLRFAYTTEIARIEKQAVSARLYLAGDAIREQVSGVGFLGLNVSGESVRSVTVSGREIPIWDRRYPSSGDPDLLPVLGVRELYANKPAVTPTEAERALRSNVPAAVADATMLWLNAIAEARRPYGRDVLRHLARPHIPNLQF